MVVCHNFSPICLFFTSLFLFSPSVLLCSPFHPIYTSLFLLFVFPYFSLPLFSLSSFLSFISFIPLSPSSIVYLSFVIPLCFVRFSGYSFAWLMLFNVLFSCSCSLFSPSLPFHPCLPFSLLFFVSLFLQPTHPVQPSSSSLTVFSPPFLSSSFT